ncbi:hypothetical protein ACFWM1_20920 [Nocardia sp. NPDC058379]|uniref:hypothetical protein n=1 Tax=unclassified Nocardia TaxID=2637762 RepID=UPI00364B5040
MRTERLEVRPLALTVGADGLYTGLAVGAVPQVSQYPSTIVPPQSGSAHAPGVTGGGVAPLRGWAVVREDLPAPDGGTALGGGALATGAVPQRTQ